MYEEEFSKRLSQLRINKGISARNRSLSISQNPGYINTIENRKALPTMTNFFYICEFLSITPQEFFDTGANNPEKLNILIKYLKQMDNKQINALTTIAEGLSEKLSTSSYQRIHTNSSF